MRRNLTQSQKAALALAIEKQRVEAAKLRRRATQNKNAGSAVVGKFPPQEQGRAREQAAQMVGGSPRYVQEAKQIARDAPELLDEVIQGKVEHSAGQADGGEYCNHKTGREDRPF